MSDIELAVKQCKRFESWLEAEFGAAGRGLHEKVSSIESRLPESTVRKLRKIATIRNKLVHESDYEAIEDRPDFLRACAEAERELKALSRRRPTWGRRWMVLGCLALAAIAIVIGMILALGS